MIVSRVKSFLGVTKNRLTLSYLAIIMLMSIGFSVVFYNTSSHAIGRQVPPDSIFMSSDGTMPYDRLGGYHDFVHRRVNEGRSELMQRLVILNLLALALGAYLSYYLAERTLRPIHQAMDAQSRFVSDASHELRTPLTIMQTENEVALRKKDLSLPRAKELLESNLEEAIRLKQLSDGLLRLARQDQEGSIHLEPVFLDEITTGVLNSIVKPATAKNISVEDSVPHIQVLAEPHSLAQAIVILLDNAVKYSDNGTTVWLKAWTKGNYGYISVQDQGPGIEEEHLAHIFERFYRADLARSKHIEGYGLGLAIAHKIIEQNRGEITVKSKPGKGSTFTITLQLA